MGADKTTFFYEPEKKEVGGGLGICLEAQACPRCAAAAPEAGARPRASSSAAKHLRSMHLHPHPCRVQISVVRYFSVSSGGGGGEEGLQQTLRLARLPACALAYRQQHSALHAHCDPLLSPFHAPPPQGAHGIDLKCPPPRGLKSSSRRFEPRSLCLFFILSPRSPTASTSSAPACRASTCQRRGGQGMRGGGKRMGSSVEV